jgi:hypothetical protein
VSKKRSQFIWISWLFVSSSVLASETLPYSTRTHPYNGWNSSVHGDNRTLGMGGATVGLADTFLASTENPAGLAMTLDGIDLNVSDNEIYDVNIQNYNNPIYLGSLGIAVNHHPWGFSAGFFNSYREGQEYVLPSNGGKPAYLETSLSEFRVGIAKLCDIKNRTISLGIALNFGTAEESINGMPKQSSALGLIVSGLYQLPNRLLLGLSYQLPMSYPVPTTEESTVLPGFYQVMKVPSRLVLGVGWIPSRIFRAGLSLGFIGETLDTTLLRDDQLVIGDFQTYQPRFGFAYTFADFSTVQSKIFAGSYLENSRIRGNGHFHGTVGLEARMWFVTLGYSADLSTDFLNNSFSLGIDLVRMLSMAELIPKLWHPPYAGLFADPFAFSDVGLPRPLVENWVPQGKPLDPVKVGLAIPALVEKKFEAIKEEIGSLSLRSGDKEGDSKKNRSKKKSKFKKKNRKKSKKSTQGKTQIVKANPSKTVESNGTSQKVVEGQPGSETKPIVNSKPDEKATAIETTKTVETTKSLETTKPEGTTKFIETTKSTETKTPLEVVRPVEPTTPSQKGEIAQPPVDPINSNLQK